MRAFLLCVLLALASGPRDARACFGVFGPRSLPADGATGVPLNAQLRLLFLRGGDAPFTVRLEDASGTRLPATVLAEPRAPMSQDPPWLATVVPEVPLAPNTAHVVTLLAGTQRWTFGFTTGADSDGVAPTAPSGLALQHEFLPATVSQDVCPSLPQRHHFTVTALPVDGAVGYRLYRDNLPVDFQDTPVAHLELASSDPLLPRVCVSLRAVDQAGNTSWPSASTCVGDVPDAGTNDGGAAGPVGVGRAPGNQDSPQRVSCGQAPVFPWVLMLALCRRRAGGRCAG